MVDDQGKRQRLEQLADLRRKKEKEIRELEQKKIQEIEELEKKKKQELEEFKKKNEDELEQAEKVMMSEMKGLTAQEEEEILKTLKKKFKPQIEEENLEDTVIQEKVAQEVLESTQVNYQASIQEILGSPDTIYQRGDMYNDLKGTLEKIETGQYLSQKERNQFYKMQEEFSSVHQTKEDSFGYVERSKQTMSAISEKLNQSTYKRNDHV